MLPVLKWFPSVYRIPCRLVVLVLVTIGITVIMTIMSMSSMLKAEKVIRIVESPGQEPLNYELINQTRVTFQYQPDPSAYEFKFNNDPYPQPELDPSINITAWAQDDPKLIEVIRKHFLMPPSEKPLNLNSGLWKSPVSTIVQKYLGYKKNGFYLEAGALTGEWISNSLQLEMEYGWNGLLVEADPKYIRKLLSKNRKAWTSPVCLSPFPYAAKMEFRSSKMPALSNLPQFHKVISARQNFDYYYVHCFPLYSLLLALNVTEVDYLSLDLEGAEYAVLQTIPFDKVNIKAISVEQNRDFRKILAFLNERGYGFRWGIWVHLIEDAVFIKVR